MKKLLFGLVALFSAVPLLCSCNKKEDYFSHVSEIRSDIFRAEENEFTVTLSCVCREVPYASDGIASPKSDLVEISLVTELRCDFSVYLVGSKEIGGEMSMRTSRGDYFYSEGVETFPQSSVTLRVEWENTSREITATSVKNENTLSVNKALDCALQNETETLSRMKQDGVFRGEFYVRLLRRDKNYYYVGIVDGNGGTVSLLLDSESGEVLARRETK